MAEIPAADEPPPTGAGQAERHTEALVIGAGPAGLAAAVMLGREGVAVETLERAAVVGASWRARYDALRLNSVRSISGLPGLALDRRFGRFVTRDDFVSYLDAYAARFRVDVHHGVAVHRLDAEPDGWRASTSAGVWRAGAVVIATGYDHTPVIHLWPGRASFEGELVHAAAYRSPGPYVGHDVLVIGSGSTGAELALDLAAGGARRVLLSVRTPPNLFPREWLGVPLQALSLLNRGTGRGGAPPLAVDALGRFAQRLIHGDRAARLLGPAPLGIASAAARGRTPVFADGLLDAIEAGAIEVVGAVESFAGPEVILTGGARVRPSRVIAATGYRRALEGLVGHLGVLDDHGLPLARSGDEVAPGLSFIGYRLPHLAHVPADARRIARRVARATRQTRVGYQNSRIQARRPLGATPKRVM